MATTDTFTPLERRAVMGTAMIAGLRLFGLFIIVPVFSAWAYINANASASEAGWVIAIYGLTQACLQIPFAMLSDRIGRKPVITLGLLIFAAGSFVAAVAAYHNHMDGIFGGALYKVRVRLQARPLR